MTSPMSSCRCALWLSLQQRHELTESNRRAVVWQGVGTSGKSMNRDECELIIGRLFYDGLLSLEMGYTAYATNAYLKLSPHGSRLLQGLLLDSHMLHCATWQLQLWLLDPSMEHS